MPIIKTYFDMPTEEAVGLKFERRLDEVVNRRLAEQLVQELMKSQYFKPIITRKAPSFNYRDEQDNITRFSIGLQIEPDTN